jgi:hypothetical protein
VAGRSPAVPGPRLAPPVPAPRDARGIHPCDLLTPDQQARFAIDPATRDTDVPDAGEACSWRRTDGPGGVIVSSATDLPVPGLDGLYLTRRSWKTFEPGIVDGFPTVRVGRGSRHTCSIYAGPADDQLISASVSVGPVDDPRPPCEVARQMVSAILANLPPLG